VLDSLSYKIDQINANGATFDEKRDDQHFKTYISAMGKLDKNQDLDEFSDLELEALIEPPTTCEEDKAYSCLSEISYEPYHYLNNLDNTKGN
jgi:hypothetical protein